MKRNILFICIMVIIPFSLCAETYGTAPPVSLQTGVVLFSQASNATNQLGFYGAFDGGFILENSATTCLFNSGFPISGSVILSNGVLTCARDLFLQGPVNFGAAGTINAAGFAVYTPSLTTAFSLPTLPILKLLATATLPDIVYSIDWSYDSAYVAIGVDQSGGGVHELFIYSFDGTMLTFLTSVNVESSVFSVRWHPSNYFLAAGKDGGGGTDLRIYEFLPGGPSLTNTGGVGNFDVTAVAWRPDGAYVAFGSSSDSEVRIVPVSGAGAVGAIIDDGTPTGAVQRNAMSWDWSGNYFAVGLANNASNELLIYNFNGVALSVPAAAEIGATVSALDWSTTNSLIAIGLTGGTEKVRVYAFNAPATLVEQTAAHVGETRDILAMQWHPSGTSLAVARIVGTGAEVIIYEFNVATSVLTAVQQFGSFDTVNALRWSRDGSYLSIGTSSGSVRVYANDITALENFIFEDTALVLRSDLNVETPYLFKGACVVEGNGHTIDCTNRSILVDDGASLLIRNATVKGVVADSVVCADSAASLTLEDVEWDQQADYAFAQGVLNIAGNVNMVGPYVFAYTSSQVCNINHDGAWFFDSGMTFSYAPTDGANNLLAMADATSLLHLYESTLYAPSTGLQFTKGTVVVEGVCPVISDAVSEANGILFGDGLLVENNAQLDVLPESKFKVTSGYLVYQNV